jgi:hypothetical protein
VSPAGVSEAEAWSSGWGPSSVVKKSSSHRAKMSWSKLPSYCSRASIILSGRSSPAHAADRQACESGVGFPKGRLSKKKKRRTTMVVGIVRESWTNASKFLYDDNPTFYSQIDVPCGRTHFFKPASRLSTAVQGASPLCLSSIWIDCRPNRCLLLAARPSAVDGNRAPSHEWKQP